MLRKIARDGACRCYRSFATRTASSSILICRRRPLVRTRVLTSVVKVGDDVQQQQRTFASAAPESTVDVAKAMSKFTQSIFDFPLGTMTREHWDDSVSCVKYWLQTDDAIRSIQDKNKRNSALHSGGPNGFAILTADRILQRLLVEQETRSPVSLRAPNPTPLLEMVLNEWLNISDQHPQSVIAVERANEQWDRIALRWRKQQQQQMFEPSDRSTIKDSFLLSSFCRLVEAWLRVEDNSSAIENAVQLLHSDVLLLQPDRFPTTIRERLVAGFVQARHLSKDRQDVRTKLIKRAEFLAVRVPGWEILSDSWKDDDLIQDYLEGGMDEQDGNQLSSFESEKLQKRVLELVQNAGQDDIETVHGIIERWSVEREGKLMTIAFTEIVFDYFIRIQDPVKAGQWLQKLEQLREETQEIDYEGDIQRILSLMKLWREIDASQARWRVRELLTRLEYLAENADVEIGNNVYVDTAELWVKHAATDRQAMRVILDIVKHTPSLDESLLSIAVKAGIQTPDASSSTIAEVLKLLLNHWDIISEDQLPVFAADAVRLMGASKESRLMVPLIKFLMNKGLLTASHTWESVVTSFSKVATPDHIIKLFDFLETNEAPLTFNAYKSSIEILIQSRTQERRIDQTVELFLRLYKKVSSRKLSCEKDELNDLTILVLEFLGYVQHNTSSMVIIDLVKERVLDQDGNDITPEIPLSIYKRAMQIQLKKNRPRQIEALFHRIKWMNEHGRTDIIADRDVYDLYIRSQAPDVKKQDALLTELFDLYAATGEASFRPLASSFLAVLSALAKKRSDGSVWRTQKLIDQIISVGVDLQDDTVFTYSMAVLIRDVEDPFASVMKIREQMEEHGIEPTFYTMRHTLIACTKCSQDEGEKALSTAMDILGKLRKTDTIDTGIYHHAVKVILRTLPESDGRRSQLLAHVVGLCRDEGYFGKDMKELLQSSVESKLWEELYSRHLDTMGREPAEWRRNVPRNAVEEASKAA